MIPEFPQFKSLELEDRKDVERFTSKFPPYSDFNFVSMWSWDVKGEMGISQLNGNLVVRFTDYINGKPFFSFLGDNKVTETANTLIEYSKEHYGKNKISLIPEHTIEFLDEDHGFDLESDVNASDYVYEVSHLANMHNWPQHTSGKHVRSFTKIFPNYKIGHFSLNEVNKEDYLELFKKWAENRQIEDKATINEFNALNRIFSDAFKDLRIVSLFLEDQLIAFTIYEIVSKDYAISHFAKSDKSHHKAVSDIINWEEAKIIHGQGIRYFNWEQDLGILGLRKSKLKYSPAFMLKKSITRSKENIS
ncbi:MAG: phosphatidylglycerol lysyltransferase domain-containing protein [Candidatus Nomurabacteria bacterium]|nr:phosphatidylglycerol lysyltransferase domain-containing protein [Candidatus Nomurabacteria bacterium]